MNIKTVLLTCFTTMLMLISTHSAALEDGNLSNVPLSIDRAGEISSSSVVSPNIMFLFDNSGSMNGRDCNGKSRNQCLKDASKELIDSLVKDGYMKTRLGIAKYPAARRDNNTSIMAPVLDIGTTLYTNEKSRCVKEEKYCKKMENKKTCIKSETKAVTKCVKNGYVCTSRGWWGICYRWKKQCTKRKTTNVTSCTKYKVTQECKKEGTRCAEYTYKTEKFSDFLKSKIDSLRPNGGTPMATGLAEIGRYFTEDSNNGQNKINIHPKSSNMQVQIKNLLNAVPVVEKPNNKYTEYKETTGLKQPIWKNYNNISAPINQGVKSRSGDDKNRCGKKEVIPDQNHVILLTDGSGNGEGYISGNKTLVNYTNKNHRQGQYVVDVAKALYEIDLQPDLEGMQNIITHPIAFGRGADTNTLNQVAEASNSGNLKNGKRVAYTASNSSQLLKIFKNILEKMEPEPVVGESRASIVFDGPMLAVDRRTFQVTFNSNPWSGDVKAYNVLLDGKINIDKPIWSARSQLSIKTDRNILTYSKSSASGVLISDKGEPRNYALLDQDQQKDLNMIKVSDNTEEKRQKSRLRFIQDLPLGDIIHSKSIYLSANKDNKQSMDALYVGANDGMLHAFDTGGQELFAYMPNGVFSDKRYRGIHYLADKKYDHQYYVDMTPATQFVGSYTALAGGLNGGGKSVYALNVSTPNNMQKGHVLWEYTDASMGYSYSRPKIIQLSNKKWVTLFGNGYPEKIKDSLPSKFYAINLEDGAVYQELSFKGKGLSSMEVVDMNDDGQADRAYAGDLDGNLWMINLNNFSQRLLFTAKAGQRITSKPTILAHPDGGVMVIFGTGSYLWEGDEKNKEVQSVYGVYDNGFNYTLNRSKLTKVTLDKHDDYRVNNNEAATWKEDGKFGWFIDLLDVGGGTLSGSERILVDPSVLGGTVFIVSMVPSNKSECDRGGYSWFMALNAETGGASVSAGLDRNNDNKFDEKDLIDSKAIVSKKLPVISPEPAFQIDPKKGPNLKVYLPPYEKESINFIGLNVKSNRYIWRIINP